MHVRDSGIAVRDNYGMGATTLWGVAFGFIWSSSLCAATQWWVRSPWFNKVDGFATIWTNGGNESWNSGASGRNGVAFGFSKVLF